MALTLVRFALRNLTRNGRRSLLTMLAMAGGLFVLVFLKALQDGYVAQRLDAGLGLTVGHLIVRPAGATRGRPGGIAGGAEVARALSSDPAVVVAAPRVRFEAFAQSVAAAAGISVVGIDPKAEAEAGWLSQALLEGKLLTPENPPDPAPVVVGETLARRLEITLGDRIALLAVGEDRSLTAEPFKLAGIFRTGAALVDSSVAYVPRAAAARMALAGGDATEVIARIREPLQAPEVAARIARHPRLRGLSLASWREAAPEVLEAMEVLRVMELIRTVVLFALVGLGIFNIVAMALYERRREFGVLMSIGMSPLALFGLLVLEVALLAIGAVLVGIGGGIGIVSGWVGKTGINVSALGARLPGALAGTTVIYPLIRPENLWLAGGWVLAISLAVLVVPLYRILRLEPATALRDRP